MKIKEYLKESKLLITIVNYIFVLILLVLKFDDIVYYTRMIFSLLSPMFYGISIAFVLNIPMSKIESVLTTKIGNKFINKNARSFAILISVIFFFIILFFIGFLIFPELIKSVNGLIINLTNLVNSAIENSGKFLAIFGIDIDNVNTNQIENILKQLGLNYSELINQSTKWVSSLSVNIVDFISSSTLIFGSIFFGFMISIYLLSAKEVFIRQLRMICASIVPKQRLKELFDIGHEINIIFRGFVGGQLFECLILGFLLYAILRIFSFPYALLIAAITAVFALVPIFGAMLSWAIGFFLILSVDPIKAAIFLIVYQLVQEFENKVIYPKVVGKSVGLPALWTLISITVFGGLFGLFGLIIAVPVTAVIYNVLGKKIKQHLKERKIKINDRSFHIDEQVYELKEEKEV